MIKAPTTTCDACGREYEFTNYKGRCPVCYPKPDPEPDPYEVRDWFYAWAKGCHVRTKDQYTTALLIDSLIDGDTRR